MASSAKKPKSAPREELDLTEKDLGEVYSADGLNRSLEQQQEQVAKQLGRIALLKERKGSLLNIFQDAAKRVGKARTLEELEKVVGEVSASIANRPPRWVDRVPAQFPTAERFLTTYFGSRLGLEGDLTITRLARIDGELADQLRSELADDPERLDALLPSPTQRADAKLLKVLGFVPTDPIERQNALSVISRGGQPGARGPYRRKAAP